MVEAGTAGTSSVMAEGLASRKAGDFTPQFQGSEGNRLLAAARSPEKVRARSAAESILSKKGVAIIDKATEGGKVSTKNMSDAEYNVYFWYRVRNKGFQSSTYAANNEGLQSPDSPDGVTVTIPDENGSETTATVRSIKEQSVLKNRDSDARDLTVYECYTTEPGKTVTVTADELAKGFATNIAQSIAEVSPDTGEILTWYTRGEQGNPPTNEVNKELSPMHQANSVLEGMIQALRANLELDSDNNELRKTIEQLEVVQKADGIYFGAYFKGKALEAIRDAREGTPDADYVQGILGDLRPLADVAGKNIQAALEEHGKNAAAVDALIKGDLGTLFETEGLIENLKNIPDITTKFFGTDHPKDAEIEKMAAKYLTPEQVAEAKKKGIGGLLVTLLVAVYAIPIKLSAEVARHQAESLPIFTNRR